MFKEVESLLEEYSGLFAGIPIFAGVKSDFAALNQELEAEMKNQLTNVAAYTMDKESKRSALEQAVLDEATKLTFVANSLNNVYLGRQAAITRSNLSRKRDRLMVAVAKGLWDVLEDNLALLVTGGITAASQVAFKAKIAAYEEAIDDKSLAALKRAAGTRGIEDVQKRGMKLLKLVKGTVAMVGSEALNKKMEDASRIANTGLRHYTVKGVVMDEDGAAVYKAVVKLVGSNGKEHVVASDKNGVFHLKSLGEDRYRVVVTHAGYFDYIKEVELIKGDVLELEVVLELDNAMEEEDETV